SNPASHGGATVAMVLQDEKLKAQWIDELNQMRNRIKLMRQKFVETLKECDATQDFDFIVKQNGMFSFSGLTAEQVDRLRDEFAIYAVRSGRINVAGITEDNIRYLCESIVKVL
ncbi:MAG: aminotransferase class I/II-fold pyridoxal phosphate-dependent enzyme, partial [Kingella sp. (in: b-proteobacteria)]